MKKINLLGYLSMALVLFFSSCSSEDISDINLKTTEVEAYEETAFATHESELNTSTTCFEDEGFNRWGWTNDHSDLPYAKYDLFAAAGQCDQYKGAYVGRVLVWYDAATKSAKVRYTLSSSSEYLLQETHLYLGSEKFPANKKGKSTVAPGQYPYKHSDLGGVKDDIYYIDNVPDGGFYFIAHAVVSK